MYKSTKGTGIGIGKEYQDRFGTNFYLRLSRHRSRRFFLLLLLNLLLTNEFKKATKAKVTIPKSARKCVLAMTKPLVRSDLVIWRPKQPQRFCLKISGCL